MLNVHELERAWLRYKIRRYTPVVVAAFSVTVLTIGTLIFWPDTEENGITASAQPTITAASTANVEPTTAQPTPPTATVSSVAAVQEQAAMKPATAPLPESQKLTPSMGFMQSLEEDAMPYYGGEHEVETVPQNIATVTVVDPVPVASATPKVLNRLPVQKPEVIVQEQSVPAPIQREKHAVSITPKDANDLQDVIKRFTTNKNPALSLFLARRYYDLGEYQSAYDYALKTNEIDSNIEESWLIFAKALVKKGEEEQAKKVLLSYIQHSNSIRAKSLLESIQKGTFQ